MTVKPLIEESTGKLKKINHKGLEVKGFEETPQNIENQFFAIANFIDNWEYWKGPQGDYLYVAPSCQRITGYEPDEFMKSPDLLNRIAHPNDQAVICRHVTEELKSQETMSLHFRIINRSGEERWIAHTCRPIHSAEGEYLGRRSANRDITAQKRTEDALRESEARYRGIFEYTKNGVAVYKPVNGGEDFVFLELNKAGEQIGRVKRDELIGKSVLEIFPAIKEFGLFKVLQRVSRTGKPENHPIGMYKDEKVTAWTENFVYKLPSEEIVAIYSDETGRKRDEDSLLRSKKDLELKSRNLEEVNTALKVLLKCREDDKIELEEKILSNVKTRILPYLEKLKIHNQDTEQMPYLEIIENSLNEIISPFIQNLSSKYFDLTPMEIQVATLVKDGKTTKDIAKLLGRSPHAIEFHRNNLRGKFNLRNKKTNLRSFLLGLI